MKEGEHLYALATECSDPRANIAALTDGELRTLAGYAGWIQKQNDAPGGIPAIVQGLCDLEAAKRFYGKS